MSESEDGKKFSDLNHLNLRPDTKKMERYIPISISITRFASFLAWTGMVSSIIFSIVSLDVIFMPLAMGFAHVCHLYSHYGGLCGTMYGVGVPSLVLNIGMFIYCFKLWGTIRRNDVTRMRKLVKIGCYIMGGLELVVCAAGVITPLGFIIYLNLGYLRYPYISGFLTIPIIIFAIFGSITSLMIHGVRKFKISLVNVNIIFKIVLFFLLVITALISVIMSSLNYTGMGGIAVLSNINVFLLYGFFFLYYNGYIVLQYNLMLGNMTEEGSMDLTHSNIQFSNNVYFIEDTVKKW